MSSSHLAVASSRGTFKFEVDDNGSLVASNYNVDTLRRLWLDRSLVDGDDLGPGNEGDFDDGAWHVGCHLLGAGGVKRLTDGRIAWLEMSHDHRADQYFCSVTTERNGQSETARFRDAGAILQGGQLLGFVEGNSTGHISARGVNDSQTRFNKWRRQDFDQPATSRAEGGKVWEHWCTLRKIRNPDPLVVSVLQAYVDLVSALGDKFAATVARGRREYSHPKQLRALVIAGFTSAEAATWDTTPQRIPESAEKKLLEARPADALSAVEELEWDASPRYYMFKRRIAKWSPASSVREDLRGL